MPLRIFTSVPLMPTRSTRVPKAASSPELVAPPPVEIPPVAAWAVAAARTRKKSARNTAQRARRSGGAVRARVLRLRLFGPALAPRGMPSSISSFSTPTGLADGLALKELRYAADAGDSPRIRVPRSPRYVGGDSAEGRGMLTDAHISPR